MQISEPIAILEKRDISGEKNPFYGKKHTEESKRKMRGRIVSRETRKKLSDAQKGKTGEKNGFYGKKHSEESKLKLSEAHKGQIPWMKGKTHSAKTRNAISERLKGNINALGYKHTEESKNKMVGRIVSKETRQKISELHKGISLSEEHKRKIAESNHEERPWRRGIPCSDEHKQKLREAMLNLDDFKGYKGTRKHRALVSDVAEKLTNKNDSVKIEQTIKINGHRRVIDILVNDSICYEIGSCKKDKVAELMDGGYQVIHLPYSLFNLN